MKKTLIVVLCAGLGVALGVGGAWAAALTMVEPLPAVSADIKAAGTPALGEVDGMPESEELEDTPGLLPRMNGRNWQPPGLMKKAWKRPDWPAPGWRGDGGVPPGLQEKPGVVNDRLVMDEALTLGQEYTKTVAEEAGIELRVDKLYEFSNGFLLAVVEDTGRPAFTLMVNPVKGRVMRAGVDLAWNTRYLRRGVMEETPAENTLTMAEAAERAREVLSARNISAGVAGEGYNFYGYYSFEFRVEGKTAGILYVNGADGRVHLDRRMGDFISVKEISE